jgi:hypothetical protein
MSRGHGRIQRDVLSRLPTEGQPWERWISLSDLVGDNASVAKVESYRRAIHNLVKSGLAETQEGSRRIRSRWSYELSNETGRFTKENLRRTVVPYLVKHYPKDARCIYGYFPTERILTIRLGQPMSDEDIRRFGAKEKPFDHWSTRWVRSLEVRAALTPENADVERQWRAQREAAYQRSVREARQALGR